MGFDPLGRLHDVLTGVGGGAQAPFGLVWDLARSPFTDDEVDGILGTINAVTVSRTGQLFGNLLGPEEGVGAVIGGLPGGVRSTLGQPIQNVFEGLETAGREYIREPLSAAFTAGSLASSQTYGANGGATGVAGLLNPQTWRDAHTIAQERSPGQAFALMFGTKDIMDEGEVERFQGTDAYVFSSGTIDGLVRLFLEPDRLASKTRTGFVAGTRTAADGVTLGTISARAAPQIGSRVERIAQVGDDVAEPTRTQRLITGINNTIDRRVEALPPSVRNLIAVERDFEPRDIARLERLEATRQELGTATPGPTFRDQFADALQSDIDTYLAKPHAAGSASRFASGRGWAKVDRLIENLGRQALGGGTERTPDVVATQAGLIRDRIFPSHPRGDILANFLAEAQGPAERQFVMRVAMGDMRALLQLEESNYALSQRLSDLQFDMSVIKAEPVLRPLSVGPQPEPAIPGQLNFLLDDTPSPVLADDFRNYTERLAQVGQEMSAVATEQARNERLAIAYKTLPAGPTVTLGGQLRNSIKSSSVYQKSRFGYAVRLITDMRPHNIIDSHDAQADAQLQRLMREAGYDDMAIANARGQFMALDPQRRGVSLQRWVERAEAQVLKDAGLNKDEIAEVLSHAALGKKQAQTYIQSAVYDAEGRARVALHDGGEILDMPLYATELQNLVVAPNLARLRKAAERYARLKYGDNWRARITQGAKPAVTTARMSNEVLRGVMDVWRPTVLLRPAWTLRVVGDEQMRMLAKFGALTVALGSRDAINNYAAKLKTNPIFKRVMREDGRMRRTTAVLGAAGSVAVAGPIGGLAVSALGNKLVRRVAQAEERGFTNLRFGGHDVSGPFGDPGSVAEAFRVRVSARNDVDSLFGRYESRILNGLRRNPKEWRTYQWGTSKTENAAYEAEWVNHVKRRVRQDPMGRQFLAGKSTDEVLDWLENTLEGRRHAALLPWRTDKEAWVAAVADQINSYTGGLEDVKRRILYTPDDAPESTWRNVLGHVPEDVRAPIHGATMEQILGARSPVLEAINGFVDSAFDALGTMATDELSRNRTFATFYRSEMQRLLADVQPGTLPMSMIERFEDNARAFALRETRELLYDLAEQSRFADMTRQLMPFYGAWQEVLTRWAGLAIENPSFASRAHQVWQAPERLGWTYEDDNGNEFLRIRLPSFAAPLVNQSPMFRGALDSQGYLFLDKKGFNLVASGTPGFGPIVQWSVSEMVKEQPSLEDSVKFVIPFGPNDDLVSSFLPPAVKRAMAVNGDEENRAFANAEARILTTKLTQMQQGDIPPVDMADPVARKEFLDAVHEEAKQFMKFRMFAGYVAPVAPLWESPYKPYIDTYRAMRDGDYKRAKEVLANFNVDDVLQEPPADAGAGEFAADDVFLDSFGEEFFSLTQAFTQSVSGVPPTLEALESSEKYGDLVTRYPEWAGVIAGYDGGPSAQFSRAVYDRQMARGERRRLTPEEIARGPETRLGWMRYSRMMDLIETIRVQQGLPNLNVKAAEPLRNIKKQAILALASKFPGWYEEFSVTDRNKWTARIDGARALVENPTLAQRPDIAGLKQYLAARDAVLAILASREQTSIDAAANQDVSTIWSAAVSRIVEQNPEFADLFYRKLENDPVTGGNDG